MLFFLPGICSTAQTIFETTKYSDTYSVKDCFKSRQYKAGFKPDTLKPNYIMKGVRIWRTVSLDLKENGLALNTTTPCTEIGLFEIIKFGVFGNALHVFSSDDFNNTEKLLLSREQVLGLITVQDSAAAPSFDADGKPVKAEAGLKKYLMGGDIKSYLLKEDWIFNNNTGKTEKYIIALAPLVQDAKTGKTEPLFWLYYPEWKGFFAAFNTRNAYTGGQLSYAEMFHRRFFISQINKESNVFDRSVKSYRHGSDVNTENELIRERINNAESDLFDH